MKTRNVLIKAQQLRSSIPLKYVYAKTPVVYSFQRKKRVSSNRQTAQRPTERRKRTCAKEVDAEINCKVEPVAKKLLGARGLGKNEAKSENSILRAYFVQTRPPEFNRRLDCWPILGGPRQESAADPQIYYLPTICHSRVAFEWPIVCAFGIEISTLPAASRAIFGIHPVSRVKWIDTRILDFILAKEDGLIELRNYLFTIDRKRPLNIKYSRAVTAPKRKRQMKVKVQAKIGFMEDGESIKGSGEDTWVCIRLGAKEKSRPGEYERNGLAVYNKKRRDWRDELTRWERNA